MVLKGVGKSAAAKKCRDKNQQVNHPSGDRYGVETLERSRRSECVYVYRMWLFIEPFSRESKITSTIVLDRILTVHSIRGSDKHLRSNCCCCSMNALVCIYFLLFFRSPFVLHIVDIIILFGKFPKNHKSLIWRRRRRRKQKRSGKINNGNRKTDKKGHHRAPSRSAIRHECWKMHAVCIQTYRRNIHRNSTWNFRPFFLLSRLSHAHRCSHLSINDKEESTTTTTTTKVTRTTQNISFKLRYFFCVDFLFRSFFFNITNDLWMVNRFWCV